MLNYNERLEAQNMSQVPFDTLEYSKILIDAGMDRLLAEAQAEAQVKIIASLMQNKLATKDDIKEVKDDIKEVKDDIKEVKDDIKDVRNEIKDVRNEIKDFKVDSELRFNELEKNLSSKIDELDKRSSTKIDEVDKRLSGQMAALAIDMNNLKNKMDTLETRIVVKMGGIVVVAFTAFGVLMKICHF